jgi:glycosyltransferase involved in cell wall biosynthesis
MTAETKRPVCILQVVGGMNFGGVETWLMHVLRHIDRERFRMDFLVHTAQPCAYGEEIQKLGSKIIPCLGTSRPWRYARNFRRALKEHGPYEVVHSHVHHFSGFVVYLAHRAGVPVRITHSHSDTSLNDGRATTLRTGYLQLMEHLIRRHATTGIACSRKAAASLYGAAWQNDNRWKVVYCGIDLEPFRQPVDRAEVRRELNIPEDAFVLGHVGRFHEPKNHTFLIDIAAEVARREPNMRLLLVGDGPLRPQIEAKVACLGLTDKVIFAGFRSDVPRLMKGAMDLFVFPSRYEGLGLVLIEAQAAGLPCVYSDTVPAEADVVKSNICRLSLQASLNQWSSLITATFRERNQSLQHFTACAFDIQNNIKILEYILNNTTNM